MAHVTASFSRRVRVFFSRLRFYHQHHRMRILSLPASDVPTLSLLQHDTTKPDSTANEEPEISSAKTLSTAVTSTVPTVMLDTDVVSDNMAARLCTSFLGHVLFLKNQVPLSVPSLAFLSFSAW